MRSPKSVVIITIGTSGSRATSASQGLRRNRMVTTPTESTANWTISTRLSPAKDWTARTSSMQRLINWPVVVWS